MYNRHFRK